MAKTTKAFETATNTYSVRGTIGHGGSGSVHLVTDIDGQEFALKRLRPSDANKQKRFLNELTFCQKEVHRNIVRVLDHGAYFDKDQKLPFYVMPRYGETLRSLINAKLQHDRILPLFDQILSGIEAAHLLRVFHRDLKPENILLNPTGPLVVADFGIAHFEEEDLFTAVETKNEDKLANYLYAAPEQKDRKGKVDSRADIFALGLILNEMFTGTVPLGLGYPEIAQSAPQFAYLDDIVKRMIQHSPSDRYTTIEKVKEELVARGNIFVELQTLDKVRNQVIPSAAPSGPSGVHDIKVVTASYDPPNLVFELKPIPPPLWINTLQCLKAFGWIGEAEPSRVESFGNGKVYIRATEGEATEVVRLFKTWVDSANKEYRIRMEADAAEKHRNRVAQLRAEQAYLQQKARVNRKLADLI